MKRKSIYELVFLAFTAAACGAPELTESGTTETPAFQLTTTQPALDSNDTTPPQSSLNIVGTPDANGEYHSDVSVSVRATDDLSGVQTVYWSLSGVSTGSGQKDGTVAYVPIINTEGDTTITYYAKDKAGNVEAAKTFVIRITPRPLPCRQVQLNDYNLFVSGDYTGGHDVRGKVAAVGNIDMHYFSLGAGLPADEIENVLVAGGELNISHGGVFGNAHYGESTTSNGTVTFYRGALATEAYWPFALLERAAEIGTLSAAISTLPKNGQVTFQSWGGLFLQGTDPKVNVFQVQASLLSSTRYFSLSVPSGSVAVINVSGYSATIANFSNAYSGVDASGVLFNFANANYLNIYNYGVFGTVLAPYAHIDFNSGSWDGGIYAGSLSGNGEGHLAPLRTFTICGDGVDI